MRIAVVFDNNTITANTISGATNLGAGMSLDPAASNPTLLNNLIAGNTGTGSANIEDVITGGQPLNNASNNFIGSVDPAADFSTTSNIIGNSQVQLGGVVGVTANGSRQRRTHLLSAVVRRRLDWGRHHQRPERHRHRRGNHGSQHHR